MSIELSIINEDLKTTTTQPASCLDELCDTVCNTTWSPIHWADGRRSSQNFLGSWFVVYDIDEGMSLEEAIEVIKTQQLWAVVGTTRSHQKEKHGKVADRFRVVLRLSEYVHDWDQYRAAWDHWREKILPAADRAAGLASQIFYACQAVVFSQEGAFLGPVRGIPADKAKNVLELNSVRPEGIKGKLSRKTLEFLVNGAEPGSWNTSIFSAARDASEQGYSQDEFVDMALRITGELDNSDHSTIASAYKYEPGNDLRADEEQVEAAEKSYSLFDKLPEVTNFLTNPHNTKGHSTGFNKLDGMLGFGLLPRYFTALTAPGKSGKTTFLTQLLFNLAKQGVTTGMMSLEMSPFRHMIPSLLSIGYGMNVRVMQPTQVQKLLDNVPETLPYLDNIKFFNQMGVTKPASLVSWIRYQYETYGTEVFMLDHVGYSLEDIADRKQHSDLAKALRKVTDDLPIHLLAIVQPKGLEYNYNGRQRASKHTLYGGATWSQDINQLLVLDRDPKMPNVSNLYLTDSHNPMARTSDTESVMLKYDQETCALIE